MMPHARLLLTEAQGIEETVVRIPERIAYFIRNKTERAAVARPSDQPIQVIKDKTAIVMDCGASQTRTGSL